MNRRLFIVGLGAIAGTACLPITAQGFATGGIVPPTPSIPLGLMPWQQHLWNTLQQGKKVMYVTSTHRNAVRAFNTLKRHKNLFCTSIGAATCGRGADLIIMDDFKPPLSATEAATRKDWYNHSVRTRLNPGGTAMSLGYLKRNR